MRSTALLGKPGLLTLCAAAVLLVPAGCKTSTASGTAGGGGADGGTMAADGGAGGMASAAADAGGSIARDVGQGVGTAAGDVASGVKSAGQGIADAGGAAVGAASGAATTAADAAREAAGGARSASDSATDGGSADGGRADSGAPDSGTGRDAGGARLSDGQIAAVAVAANKVDIAAGQAAKRKSKNAQVKKFANDMIRDHTSANKQAQTLAQRLGLKPEENEMSRAITQGGEDNLATLKTLKGKEFDRAYAEHEVAFHQQVLGALDEKLIPNAQNADLKSLLQSVRAVVAEHLDHAQSLMESLSK
jgi:putative membrane protein